MSENANPVNVNAEIDRLYNAGYERGRADYPRANRYVAGREVSQEWLDGYIAGQEDAKEEAENG